METLTATDPTLATEAALDADTITEAAEEPTSFVQVLPVFDDAENVSHYRLFAGDAEVKLGQTILVDMTLGTEFIVTQPYLLIDIDDDYLQVFDYKHLPSAEAPQAVDQVFVEQIVGVGKRMPFGTPVEFEATA